jgi:hypothetical protein
MIALQQALSVWTSSFGASSGEFCAKLTSRFPGWPHLGEFCRNVPKNPVTMEADGSTYGWLWNEVSLSKHMDENNSSRYLTVGTLPDGSSLAIDTQDEEDPFRIGSFSVDLCGEDNWTVLEPSRYRAFPFSYPEYLEYLRGNPHRNYLVG